MSGDLPGSDALLSLVSRPATPALWARLCAWIDAHVEALGEVQRHAVDVALSAIPDRLRTVAPAWIAPRLDPARARFARCLDTRALHGATTARLQALVDEVADAGLALNTLVFASTTERSTVRAWTRALPRLSIATLELPDIAGLSLWFDDDPQAPSALRTLAFDGAVNAVPLTGWLRRDELVGLTSLRLGGGVYRSNPFDPEPLDPLIDAMAARLGLRALAVRTQHFAPDELTRLSRQLGPRLERLALVDCAFDDDALSALLDASDWPALQALDLSENQLSADGLERLARAPLWSQLRELALGTSGLGGLPMASTRHRDLCPHEPSARPRGGLAALCSAGHAPPSLRTLRVPDNTLRAADVAQLVEWLGAARLETLDLSQNLIHAHAIRELYADAVRDVTDLDLSGCGLEPRAARPLVKAPWTRLKRLDLTDNPLGSDAAIALIEARWAASLQRLEVTVADVGPEGMRALQRAGLVAASASQVAPEASAIAEAGAGAWHHLLGHMAALDDSLVGKPPPDLETTFVEEGVAIVVTGLDPSWTWRASSRTLTGAGNPEQGFYWLEIGDHHGEPRGSWRLLVEALTRWRRVVPGRGDPDLSAAPDLPGPWQVAGWSAGPGIEVPDLGLSNAPTGQVGLYVDPFAIWLPGHVLVMLDDTHPAGATYIGEPGATPRYARWLESAPPVEPPAPFVLRPWRPGAPPEAVAETRDGLALEAAEAVAVPERIELPAERTRWQLADRLEDCALVFTVDEAHLLVQPYRRSTLIVLRTWPAPDGQPWPAMIVETPSEVRRLVPDPWRPHLVHVFLDTGRARLDLSSRRLSEVVASDRGVFMARAMPDRSLWLAVEDPDRYDCELLRCAPNPDDEAFPWGERERLGALPRALEDVWDAVTVSPATGQLVRGSMSRLVLGSAGDERAVDLDPPEHMRWGGYGLDAAGATLMRVLYPDDEDAGLQASVQWCVLPALATVADHAADIPGYVDTAAVSPDGELVVVNGRSALHVWSRESLARSSAPLARHTDADLERGLAFSPGGTHLAGASRRGVELWPVPRLVTNKS